MMGSGEEDGRELSYPTYVEDRCEGEGTIVEEEEVEDCL